MVHDSLVDDDEDITDEIRELHVGTIPYFLVRLFSIISVRYMFIPGNLFQITRMFLVFVLSLRSYHFVADGRHSSLHEFRCRSPN